ncbi:hypothetical protein [Actinokineospora enzanensis]|uniref:hypothetical protein n=1 Tax=Actinokineospora enzanensis TaxID=155975 RepID=UPI0012EB69DC|nr:hypothetical protein [Actinokineospora enzanensis]
MFTMDAPFELLGGVDLPPHEVGVVQLFEIGARRRIVAHLAHRRRKSPDLPNAAPA